MTLFVYPGGHQIDSAFSFAKRLVSLGFRCVMDENLKSGEAPRQIEFLPEDVCGSVCDMIVSVGGDGTMLKAAQCAVMLDKPVFGLNAGRIGFLCAFDYREIDSIGVFDIETLCVSERMLLQAVMDNRPENKFFAINDIVLYRGNTSKTVEFTVQSSSGLIGEYRADGVIISTPTGSTGYSLSAGGSIVEPQLDVLLVTPICPHTMLSRSVVLGGSEEIRLIPSGRNDADVNLSVDSSHRFHLKEHCGVTVTKSSKTLKLMMSAKRDYFKTLNRRIRDF